MQFNSVQYKFVQFNYFFNNRIHDI